MSELKIEIEIIYVMLSLFQHLEKHRKSVLEILKQVQNDSFHTSSQLSVEGY